MHGYRAILGIGYQTPNITQLCQSGIVQLVPLFQKQLNFKKDGGSILKNCKETQKRLLCTSTVSVRMKHNYQMVFMFVLQKQAGKNTFICIKQLCITTKGRKDFLNYKGTLQIICHFFLQSFVFLFIFLYEQLQKSRVPPLLFPPSIFPSRQQMLPGWCFSAHQSTNALICNTGKKCVIYKIRII